MAVMIASFVVIRLRVASYVLRVFRERFSVSKPVTRNSGFYSLIPSSPYFPVNLGGLFSKKESRCSCIS